jgi:hypothetical protein
MNNIHSDVYPELASVLQRFFTGGLTHLADLQSYECPKGMRLLWLSVRNNNQASE